MNEFEIERKISKQASPFFWTRNVFNVRIEGSYAQAISVDAQVIFILLTRTVYVFQKFRKGFEEYEEYVH